MLPLSKMTIHGLLLLVFFMGNACSKTSPTENQSTTSADGSGSPSGKTHLKYFGYVGIDCFLDDPHDSLNKTNYADEVGSFSNIAHVCVYSPNDNLRSRLEILKANGLRAILDLHFLFYQLNAAGPVGASGKNYDLYPDYLARWNQFFSLNKDVLTDEYVQVFYPADEPTWVGVTYQELNPIVALLKNTLPTIKIAVVEASQVISSLTVPSQVDWVGMDRYGTANVTTDASWLSAYQAIKAKRSAPHQKVLIIMDAQWVPVYGEAGYPPSAMEAVNRYYFEMAQSDTDVIGIIAYSWAGGIGSNSHFGMRNLPSNVIDENKRIGRIITGK
jgi:hypothetical protein